METKLTVLNRLTTKRIVTRLITTTVLVIAMFPLASHAQDSICFGTTSDGWLKNGVQLPATGPNFVAYSAVARLVGRTYVHSEVRHIFVAAYATLEQDQPEKVYKYAESGFQQGGEFKPHKTHRNGLSIDFMTPMKNAKGKSVHLPTHILNKLGYNIELDQKGRYKGLSIDYDALAAHIVALHKAAKERGHDIWRVIFDPALQAPLFKTRYGNYLKASVTFSKNVLGCVMTSTTTSILACLVSHSCSQMLVVTSRPV